MKQFILLIVTLYLSARAFSQNSETIADSSLAGRRHNHIFYQNGNNTNSQDWQNNQWSNQLSNTSFYAELRKINNQRPLFRRKNLARQLADLYQLTAVQVAQLCNIFYTYSRVDIAKYCYTRCYDPTNYGVVFNSMDRDMADELNDYIACTEQPFNPLQYGYNPAHSAGYNTSMSVQSFNAAKQTIADIDFDNTRLETAKGIAAINNMSAGQVAALCRLFDFESNRLEFAKFAYAHTSDKNNYFVVNNVFDFDASKSDLNRFIQQQG